MSATSLDLEWPSQKLGNFKNLYRSRETKAVLGRILSSLTGYSRRLRDLSTEISGRKVHRQYFAGYRTVPVKQITGSEGRSGDYDCEFNPLHARMADRWVSIAFARSRGIALPPVELIQLGEDYFVRDGHHRISVARASGAEYIDARVIVLEMESERISQHL